MESIPSILAERYASEEMKAIWSARGKIVAERRFWLAVLKAQRDLGLAVRDEAVSAYERVVEEIDLEDIQKRECVTRHDVKARIEAFNAVAGYEEVHKGLTSRDLTENVEQLQVFKSLQVIRIKAVSCLVALGRRADEFKELLTVARTHNVAAQPTTLGRRFTMFGEELVLALERIDRLLGDFRFRGLKGATGTQLDQLTLFDGDSGKVAELESRVAGYLGAPATFASPGQVYPRSLDFEVVSAVFQLAAGPANLARMIRLMAGHDLLTEGFSKGQVGSSAMPHKVNSRSCERIDGFRSILQGHVAMAASLAGGQWNEGDVSCSVVRRVVLPDSFFTIDGLLETLGTVLRQLEVFPEAIAAEKDRYMPFLATTTVLMESVKQGVGRESAHDAIKEHALAALRRLRSGEAAGNDLFDRLAGDSRLGLTREQIEALAADGRALAGRAAGQVEIFLDEVRAWRERFPEAESYEPAPIL